MFDENASQRSQPIMCRMYSDYFSLTYCLKLHLEVPQDCLSVAAQSLIRLLLPSQMNCTEGVDVPDFDSVAVWQV